MSKFLHFTIDTISPKRFLLFLAVSLLPLGLLGQTDNHQSKANPFQPFLSIGTGSYIISKNEVSPTTQFNGAAGIGFVPAGFILSLHTGIYVNTFSDNTFGRINWLSIPLNLQVNYINKPQLKLYLGSGIAVNYINTTEEIASGNKIKSFSLRYFAGGDFIRKKNITLGVELRYFNVHITEDSFSSGIPGIRINATELAIVLRLGK